MKKHFGKITLAVFILVLLASTYMWGGNIPQNESVSDAPKKETKAEIIVEEKEPEEKEPREVISIKKEKSQPKETESETFKETALEDKPQKIVPQEVIISDKEYRCTLSVRCDNVFENISLLDPEKIELIPEDGVILPPTEVIFYDGESVFNLLLREMRKNNIHFEYVNTPLYNSAYIEGINNLYEFDCGELSGWMYKVNGWFPNYGSSRYLLENGDRVEWIYTCNLGRDVGELYLKQRDS